MKTIAVIGAGQLGSRHLQGLAHLPFQAKIQVVDPFESALSVAKQRYNEVEQTASGLTTEFFSSIAPLSDGIDLCIIATNSDVRFEVLKTLVAEKKVKNLILEKVLFQTVQEYHDALGLITGNGINAWVNHPRRLFPFYKKLREQLVNDKSISFTVQGGNWGLGCNALHFIDLFSFLTGDPDQVDLETDLDQAILESKRSGYQEFSGRLIGRIGRGRFQLFSHVEPSPVIITIVSDSGHWVIDEGRGVVRYITPSESSGWKDVDEKIVYYQSELASPCAVEIIEKNHSDLPTYRRSMDLHLLFTGKLLQFLSDKEGKEVKRLAIT